MVLRHPEYGQKTAVYHYQFCDWSANPSSLYEKDAPPVYILLLLLLLLLPQLQFSLDKIILFFSVLFPYYKLMLHVIYHNICFICLLASDPVLLIKLLNNLGAGNNTHRCMHKYLNPWLLFSRQFKHTHTSTSFPWLQFG